MAVEPATLQTPYEYAEELLDVLAAAVGDTQAGAIERVYVAPGRPAHDCEQLTISLIGVGEADTVVVSALALGKRHKTGRVNLLTFLVTVIRDCVPTIDDNGNLPTSEDEQASASEVIEDVWAIWTYLYWAFRRGELLGGKCDDLVMDGAIAIETEGTLAGFEVEFRVNIPGIVNAS
jgi:hypothetical protein